jgi:D-3-phosphoglycerate dehydrogenase
MQWRVLNMGDVSEFPEVLDPLQGVADVVSLPADAQVLRKRIGEFDAYLATLHVQVDRAMLQRPGRLRVIATPSSGVDHLDLEAMRERGIALVSFQSDIGFLNHVTASAEMSWGLLLAVVRRLPWAFDAARGGDWARDQFRGHQLAGKTLGVLGYGRLGRMVAQYAKAFRMRVLVCDVKPIEPGPGIERVALDELLAEADVLSIHVDMTAENRGLIGAENLARMKPGAVLVSISHGAVIDEAALLDALQKRHLAAAALDMIDGEWRTDLDQHPLIRYANTHENLIITPHVGGVTYESQRMAYTHTAKKLARHLESLKT